MQIEFSTDEGELLEEVLEAYRQDLRSEIFDTDNPGYKDQLKAKEKLVERLQERLRSVLAPSSPTARH